jgi:hypothetical protein
MANNKASESGFLFYLKVQEAWQMVHRRGWRADRERRVIHLLSCPHAEVCMVHQTSQSNMV